MACVLKLELAVFLCCAQRHRSNLFERYLTCSLTSQKAHKFFEVITCNCKVISSFCFVILKNFTNLFQCIFKLLYYRKKFLFVMPSKSVTPSRGRVVGKSNPSNTRNDNRKKEAHKSAREESPHVVVGKERPHTVALKECPRKFADKERPRTVAAKESVLIAADKLNPSNIRNNNHKKRNSQVYSQGKSTRGCCQGASPQGHCQEESTQGCCKGAAPHSCCQGESTQDCCQKRKLHWVGQ